MKWTIENKEKIALRSSKWKQDSQKRPFCCFKSWQHCATDVKLFPKHFLSDDVNESGNTELRCQRVADEPRVFMGDYIALFNSFSDQPLFTSPLWIVTCRPLLELNIGDTATIQNSRFFEHSLIYALQNQLLCFSDAKCIKT